MRRTALLLLLLLGAASTPVSQSPAAASCAAPSLTVSASLVLERGASVEVEGDSYLDGCQDAMTCTSTFGCDDCAYDDAPPQPLTDVSLRLEQGARSWPLDSADAQPDGSDEPGRVVWEFDVPRAADPGPATLVSDHAEPVRVRVR